MIGLRASAFKLAVFTIFTAVVTTWLAAIIGNFQPFSQRYELTAQFSDATGLLVGDSVKAAGVTVGRVAGISIEDGVAVVTMEIDEGVRLPSELGAAIRFRNLIGQRMITLSQEGESPAFTSPGDLIPLDDTTPAFDLSALFNGLRPLIQSTSPRDINAVTETLNQALRGRSDEIEAFLGNVGQLSDSIASRDRQLSSLLENVNIVAEDLNGRDAQLQTTLSNLRAFLTDLAASRDELDSALVSLDDASERLGRVVDQNGDDLEAELADLSLILDAVNDKRSDLRAAVRSLPELLVGIERTNGYGQWPMIHLVNVCKDDLGTCGRRRLP